MKRRIAVIAYAFSPTRGSEFSQGWNYITKLSQDFDVTVYVGSSDGRMGQLTELHNCDFPFKVVLVEVEGIGKFWKWLDINIGIGWAFVYALRSWNAIAVNKIYLDHASFNYDLVHHLGPVGFKAPSDLYKIGIPSYWGPIGGYQYVKLRLAYKSGLKYFFTSCIRNFLTWQVARSKIIKNAINGFTKISFATPTNLDNFKRLYGVNGAVLSDQAVRGSTKIQLQNKMIIKNFEVIWCGSLDCRKNVKLLVDIARQIKRESLPISINVVGGGHLQNWLEKTVFSESLNINYLGFISREEVESVMMRSRVILFTSLSEANTSTFFEGLEALCIPVALRLDGFIKNITPDIGHLVDINNSYKDIISSYTVFLKKLYDNNNYTNQLHSHINDKIIDYSWDNLYGKHKAVIDELLEL